MTIRSWSWLLLWAVSASAHAQLPSDPPPVPPDTEAADRARAAESRKPARATDATSSRPGASTSAGATRPPASGAAADGGERAPAAARGASTSAPAVTGARGTGVAADSAAGPHPQPPPAGERSTLPAGAPPPAAASGISGAAPRPGSPADTAAAHRSTAPPTAAGVEPPPSADEPPEPSPLAVPVPPPIATEHDEPPPPPPPPAAEPPPPALSPWAAGVLLGLGATFDHTTGGVNPLGFGFGLRGEYRMEPWLVGARMQYFVGGSSDLPTGRVSMLSWVLALEGAYVLHLEPLLIQPGVLLGVHVREIDNRITVADLPGPDLSPGSQNKNQVGLYIAPGVSVIVPLGVLARELHHVFAGMDVRLDLAFGSRATANLQLMLQAGVRF